MSDLIVIGYPDETTAQNVWDELVKLENDLWVPKTYATRRNS
jgi:uncharacterized membrane protein